MEPMFVEVQQIPARTPLSLRVPTILLEKVQRYAQERGTTRTDAFLSLVERGLEATQNAPSSAALESLERKTDQILALLQDGGESRTGQDAAEAIAVSKTVAQA